MEWWLQIILAMVTTAVGIIVPLWMNHLFSEMKAREDKRIKLEQDRNDLLDLLRDALKAVLRDRLLQARRYFCNRGFITAQEFENVSAIYKAYEKLGGNDLGHKAYEDIKDLPFEDPMGGANA